MPFRDITGHQRLIELLARSIAGGTLPPSLLFAGSAGVSKRKTAIAVAQALNCLTPDRGDSCGACAACTRIARGIHPDVFVVEPGESPVIRVDDVREVIDRAAYRPFEGRRRVVIVDPADMLMPQAQNALLKTLEEPTSSSVFILLSVRSDMLLPTVRSRCIRLMFAETAVPHVDEDARAVAQRVLEHASTTTDPGRRMEGARELLAKTGAGGASDRDQVSRHLHAMASLIRDVEVLTTGADSRALANPDVRPVLERLTPAFQGERGVRAFAAIDQALIALAPPRNAGVKVVADWLVLQL